MLSRPVLIGMNNPLSAEPRHALFPHPPGCTGHRIYCMLRDHNPGLLRGHYLQAFDRMNVLDSVHWDRMAALAAGRELWVRLQGRTAVVLGAEARMALCLPEVAAIEWRKDRGVRWCLLPHPSGRNLWYNDPMMRACAGLLLDELYHTWRGEDEKATVP